ncbi:hypothetical protein N0V90_009232 [Kalmusia sp. IMI 367209]|nr:hypothetical protein N0V90_009232 [Kalmusia sp. IMI 367209]
MTSLLGHQAGTKAPFTPRSSSFPDTIDSDDDVFDPTPIHSPSGGPHYDDLPPSYAEAQQQALHDARNGIPPLNPDDLDATRLHIDESEVEVPQYEVPAGAEVRAHRASAEEIARENRRHGSGVSGSVNVPVQQVGSVERVPVGRVQSATSTTTTTVRTPADQANVLLSTALQFTRHEPDTDARYAPRLTRCIAVPQDNVTSSGRKGKARRDGRRAGRRGDAHVPGAWPGTSTETLSTAGDEPARFLRAYAKALHAHSIRPAEFLDFLDGLNALCAATDCTPADLVRSDLSSDAGIDIVRNYINATNEVFFSPRGLKVSVRSFGSLLDTIKIPEERGQRAGAVASVLDPKSTPAKRAQALHPWIEALEMDVPEPSIAVLTLKEMGEKFRSTSTSRDAPSANERPQPRDTEKSALEREYAERERDAGDTEDPPHSIPGEYPQPAESPHPPFGGWRGRGSGARGRGGPWTPFGAPGHGPFGHPGHGPHGPPGFTHFGPPGHGPHGPPGFGPFGPPGHGPWGPANRGPFGPPGTIPWGFQPRGGSGSGGNGWEALGHSLGKLGEEFGKRMEAWGDQLAKDASSWGNDISKRAETLGQRASGSASGCNNAGPGSQRAPETSSSSVPPAATVNDQDTGIHHANPTEDHIAVELQKHAEKQAAKKHTADDASSISSNSSSSSSSSSDTSDDEDEEKHPNTSAIFASRVREINTAAEASRAKGKKSSADIERERALAIEKAAKDKTALEEKIEQKRTKRAIMREFKSQRRELMREHRQARRELRRQGLGKKSKEYKEAKKGHREKKKALRKEKYDVRRQFREARKVEKSERRAGIAVNAENGPGESVWIVVENLTE